MMKSHLKFDIEIVAGPGLSKTSFHKEIRAHKLSCLARKRSLYS